MSDIGACDEQNESDCAKQHEQRRLNFADDLLFQGRDFDIAICAGILLFEARRDSGNFRLSLRECDTGPEARENSEAVAAAIVNAVAQYIGRPQFRVRGPERGKLKFTRHDSDDGEGRAVEQQRLAKGIAVAAETPLPQAIAQNYFVLRAFLVFADREAIFPGAAQCRAWA